jgi:predicted KAP-like P-loop ATPase
MQINGLSTHYHSDQPVSNSLEDRFQRYNFARRIAQTIQSNSSSDALVIGIYGSWGEGKTSVLNFIEKELEGDRDQIIVKFNPWRFSEEQTLMLQF